MINPELSRRLAPLNDTDYFRKEGYDFYHQMVKAAEKAETWDKLPNKWKKAVEKAEKDSGVPWSKRKLHYGL